MLRRVENGIVTIDTTMAEGAVSVEIDPDIRLIDRDRANNRQTLLRIPALR
jgi:hypothetical protein